MKKIVSLFCALIFSTALVFSQQIDDIDGDTEDSVTAPADSTNDSDSENSENSDDKHVEDDIDGDEDDEAQQGSKLGGMNEAGDQFIKVAIMVDFPLNFGEQLKVGGAGSLGYHRFLKPWLAIGGDVSFGYHPTLGSNIFTFIPIVFDVTFQPTFKRFEFPVTLGVGVSVESYLNRTYFPGFTAKAQAGAFFRATPSWSFGIEGDFTFMPQWYEDSKYNDYGLFMAVAVSARYHF